MNSRSNNEYDVIVIGGSCAGLSAAMTFGRSLRHTLVIDSGKPCNRQTPHSHNFITQDGETPANILAKTREQLKAYDTVKIIQATAQTATQKDKGFQVTTDSGDSFSCRKLVIATGVKDVMLPIPGFAECWGISVLHCPYCHGYEVHSQPLGILGDGDVALHFVKLIYGWSKNLVLITNGPSTLTPEHKEKLKSKNISVIEKEIAKIEHRDGQMKNVVFTDGTEHPLTALFARPPVQQNTTIPADLGCKMTSAGLVEVSEFQKTSVAGVYAAGDCTTPMRTVSVAVAAGTKAGALTNMEMAEEDF